MYCKKCGCNMETGDRFCPRCGHPVSMPAAGEPDDPTQQSGSAGAPAGDATVLERDSTVPSPDTTVPSSDSTVPSPVPAPPAPPSQQPSYDYPSPVGEAPTGTIPVVDIPHFSYGDEQPGAAPDAPEFVPASQQMPAQQPQYDFATQAAAAQPLPQAAAPAPTPQSGAETTGASAGGTAVKQPMGLVAGIIAAASVLVILVIALVWFVIVKPHMEAGTANVASSTSSQSQAGGNGSSSGSSGDASSSTSSDGSDKNADADKGKAAKVCAKTPELTVSNVTASGDGLTVSLAVKPSSSCGSDESLQLDDASSQITISDGNGTAAAAVFDFSKDPVVANPGKGAAITAKFGKGQFWRLASEYAPSASSLKADVKTGVSTKGSSSSSDPYNGAQADNTVREAGAKAGIEWQIAHDKSSAQRFMTTITTQLSSKQLNMQAEGKTWSYQDIYQQYVDLRRQWPNALMLWSGDWPTYTDTGTGSYYVIISGESFGSVQSGWNWCSSNGFGSDDCLPVDLQ